ncbi:MAG TPA: hypothetical protein PLO39_08620 [Saprospiraceae bacterium]|nr:hypothetical protein [Saprospiraceae bacterium]
MPKCKVTIKTKDPIQASVCVHSMHIMAVIEDIHNGNLYRQNVKHSDKSEDYAHGYLDALKHIMEQLPMFSE